jgi:phosphoglycolate phosphatase
MSVGVRAVLFDLDGTLADTAPDLGYVLNLQRAARGLEIMPLTRLRPVVSQGARGLLRVGFGLTPQQQDYEAMRDEFLELYARNLCRETRLFDGMEEVLDALESLDRPWGIVTNKLHRYTEPLVEALGLHGRAGCVISGDTCARAKPHPDPLLEAARRLGIEATECVYVGDDERDMQAGRAASMLPVVALYGYLGEGTDPQSWDFHAAIQHPLDLLQLLRPEPTASAG